MSMRSTRSSSALCRCARRTASGSAISSSLHIPKALLHPCMLIAVLVLTGKSDNFSIYNAPVQAGRVCQQWPCNLAAMGCRMVLASTSQDCTLATVQTISLLQS